MSLENHLKSMPPTHQQDGVTMNQFFKIKEWLCTKYNGSRQHSLRARSSKPQHAVSLVCALALFALAPSTRAGEVYVTGAERKHIFNNGFVTASTADKGSYAEGNAYEFLGGVGASAFASTKGIPGTATQTGALGKASFSDRFRVALGYGTDAGEATSFLLTVTIIADGTAALNWQPHPGNARLSSFGSALYEYSWSVLNVSGSGRYSISKTPTAPEQIYDTKNGSNSAVLMVTLGQVVPLSFTAKADVLVTAFGSAGVSGTADFGHTLRWGGVTSISAFDNQGQRLSLPTNFSLSLVSETTGFDYNNAAGPNPFVTTPVPEPETYAMLLAGLGLVGAAVRRRRQHFDPTIPYAKRSH